MPNSVRTIMIEDSSRIIKCTKNRFSLRYAVNLLSFIVGGRGKVNPGFP